eukprot:TRINITY_DN2719_c0_g1_i1.p1 TRINITY_DN2719_c0_g1~~TRINITY_DN2719_c0_g1_i1.p1  ORF type:complete len:122 (-),score=24.41 TRINITY_DN2719_c0_g1_i1:65-430(-)
MRGKTLLLKVMFPRTSPIVSKIFNIDASLTVRKVISQIAEHVKSGLSVVNCGLYLPKHGIWLDEEKHLSEYTDLIKTADCVEFKEKKDEMTHTGPVLALLVGAAVVTLTVGLIYIRSKREL